MNHSISALLAEQENYQIELIGLSGGGAVAHLIASRCNEIKNIRTMAGNIATP